MGKYVFGLVFLFMMMSCGEDYEIFIPKSNQGVTGDIGRLTTKLKQDIAGDIHYTVSCPCSGDKAFEFRIVEKPPKGVIRAIPEDWARQLAKAEQQQSKSD